MAISERLKAFLKESRVRFSSAKHPVAYTAQEIAASQHVPGHQLAKSVLVLTHEGPTLAVLSAIRRVDLAKLKRFLRAKKLSIGRESDIKRCFPDVEIGAMSPFGNLYDVPVAVDKELSEVSEIVFNGGSHSETIKLAYADFARLVGPKIGVFAEAPKKPKKAAAKKRKVKKSPKKRVSAKKKSARKKTAKRKAKARKR